MVAPGGARPLTALLVLALAVLAAVWAGPTLVARATDGEKTVLGNLLSRTLSTPSSRVSIGAVDGALSSDATIRDVAISDAEGVWLKLDRARLVWRRLGLLTGRLEVDSLDVGRVEILRRPLPGPTPPEAEPDGTLLPDLPVKVEVKAFRLGELVLGEGVAGQPARLAAEGKAKLGNPSEGLDLFLEGRRLDAPGRLAAQVQFVPKGERLELKASLDEPAGGLVARLAGLPGTPPLVFALDGRGTLDAWSARLDFDAGPEVGARGTARIDRLGPERRLTLDLSSRIEGLVPGPVAAVFAGTTQLDGSVRFPDAGGLAIEHLGLQSRTARLAFVGRIASDRTADLAIEARSLLTEGGRTRTARSEIEELRLDGSLKGALAAPTVRVALRAAGLRTPEVALDRIEAAVTADPGHTPETRFVLGAQARMEGLSLSDPAMRRASGTRATLAFRANVGADGVLDIATLSLDSESAHLGYAGRIGTNTLTGTVEARLDELSAYSGLAGRPLSGSLTARVGLSGDPARKSVSAAVDASAQGLSLGAPSLDRMVGATPRLHGRVAQSYDGYGFEDLRFDAERMRARLTGRATTRLADVTGRIELADLGALDSRLTGAGGADLHLTGSLERPNLAVSAAIPQGTSLGREIRALKLDAALSDLATAPQGSIRVSGAVSGQPLTATADFARPRGTLWTLEGLSLALGSVAVEGRVSVDATSWLADGRLSMKARTLDDLTPLALMPLSGRLAAELSLDRSEARQAITLRGTGTGLRFGSIGLARLEADLTAGDLWARPRLGGHLVAERLIAGGANLDRASLEAVDRADASELTLKAQARGLALDAAARLVPADAVRIELQRFSAIRGPDKVVLTAPTVVAFEDGSVRISDLGFSVGGGRVSLTGRGGKTLDLAAKAEAIPLAALRMVAPNLSISGSLSGEAVVTGALERPEGRYALSLDRIVTSETRKAGLPPVGVTASGTLRDGAATVDARVAAGRGADVTVDGAVPLAAGEGLALRARGSLDAALANSWLSLSGQRVGGRVTIDARVSGTTASPRVEGGATLVGGTFEDALNGVRLTAIEGRVSGRGDALVVERLSASTRNGGRLGLDGRITVDPANGFPGTLTLSAERAELVSSPLVTAVASLRLTVGGPLARSPRVTGRVSLASVDVTVPDRLPATVQALPGIRRVNTPPALRVRLASRATDAKPARKAAAAAPFEAALDVTVDAPNRIFVRGRGIDAELGGSLRLTGSTRAPRAVGAFEMRQGRLTLVGQRLDFTRGRVGFAGALATPELDFLAQTKAGDVTARVGVTGPADQPVFALTSDPSLPQDEVLSRLLFKKAAGGLSPFQALQLAQAVGQLSGGGSTDMFEQARKGLGLDSLDVSTGASGGPAVGASRYIGDRLSVGVRAGAKPADTAATVDYDVTRRVKLKGEAGSDGRTAVGVGAEWEW